MPTGRTLLFVTALVFSSSAASIAASAADEPKGKAEYQKHCAACHGNDGRGFGVVAEKIKRPTQDLTQLAKLNNGVYPADEVANAIRTGGDIGRHKSVLMPAWQEVYGESADPKAVDAIVADLTQYVESLQEK